MTQLNPKQIKLSGQYDLLMGGTSGNGTSITIGSDTQVLKVTSGILGYGAVASDEVTFSDASYTATNVSTALVEVKTIADNLSNFNALNFAGTLNASTDSLPSTPAVGNVYRITGAGNFSSTLSYTVNIGDFIAYAASSTWVKMDNTDVTLSSSSAYLTVSGSSDTGYSLDFSGLGNVTSANTAINVTGGTGVLLGTGLSLTFNAGNVSIIDLSGTLTVAKGGTGLTAVGSSNKYLGTTDGSVLSYNYIQVVRNSSGNAIATATTGRLLASTATIDTDNDLAYVTKAYILAKITGSSSNTKIDEDNTVSSASANYSWSLSNTPVGDVSVFFNGIKLTTGGYSVSGKTVTLNDTINGYTVEVGDVLSATYMY